MRGVEEELGDKRVRETRRQIENNWRAEHDGLAKAGYAELAGGVDRFVACMPPALTDLENIAHQLQEHAIRHALGPSVGG